MQYTIHNNTTTIVPSNHAKRRMRKRKVSMDTLLMAIDNLTGFEDYENIGGKHHYVILWAKTPGNVVTIPCVYEPAENTLIIKTVFWFGDKDHDVETKAFLVSMDQGHKQSRKIAEASEAEHEQHLARRRGHNATAGTKHAKHSYIRSKRNKRKHYKV